ncbi:MAG: diguanylate cyclase [Rudaea sp.]
MIARILLFLILLLPGLTFAAESLAGLQARVEAVSGRDRVDALNAVAKAYWGVSTDESLAYADRALTLASQLNYAAGEAAALRNEGIGYWYREQYQRALDKVLQAQRIYERLGDKSGIAGCLSTTGTIYLNLDRFDNALAAYRRALDLAEQTGDSNRIGIVLSNLGTTSLGLKQPEQALGYFQRALAILERDGSQLDVLTALANIGGAQRRLKRYDEALKVDLRIVALAEKAGSKVRLADALSDTGQILTLLKRYGEAEPYLKRAVDIAHAAGLKRNEREAELELVKLYEAQGDLREALKYFHREDVLRDAIFSEESARATAELQQKYESDKKERELHARQLELTAQRNSRNFFIALSLLVCVIAAANYGRFRSKKREAKLLDRLARTDALTGLLNRRAVMESLVREQHRLTRSESSFSLMLADIDHFKQVNDRFGHDVGDEVLVKVATALRSSARSIDEVARWGGEEFLVLMPDCALEQAVEIGERMRGRLHELSISAHGKPLPITASFGVSTPQSGESVEEAIRRADQALYRSKQEGRDRVSASRDPGNEAHD